MASSPALCSRMLNPRACSSQSALALLAHHRLPTGSMSSVPSDAAAAPLPALHLTAPVVLGSSSKWRAQAIREMGVPLAACLNPNIDEYAVRVEGRESEPRDQSDPAELCMAVAVAKARFLLSQPPLVELGPSAPAQLLVTSDQVAYHAGRVREKPRDAQQCREWFPQYASPPGAQVVTAVVVSNTATGQRYAGVALAAQQFLPVPPALLDEVIERGHILQCCGGFMVDDPALLPFLARRTGTEDEVIGLPKRLLARLLTEAQRDIDAANQAQQASQAGLAQPPAPAAQA